AREHKVARTKTRLNRFDQCGEQESIVVEIRGQRALIAMPRRVEAAVAPRGGDQPVERRECELRERRLVERSRRARKRRDHQRVPRREYLVVEARPYALRAPREKRRAGSGKTRLDIGRRD